MLSCGMNVSGGVESWRARVGTYLEEVLGLRDVRWRACEEVRLPVYLQASYEVACTSLLGVSCAFAHRQTAEPTSPSATAKQLAQLAEILDRPVVLVEPVIPSWRRKRLIERKVAFVAPFTQLYLPPLGIDLRDAIRRQATGQDVRSEQTASPVTQAVLLHLLLHRSRTDTEMQAAARRTGYSAMSLSRAARDLERMGLVQRIARGRKRLLRLVGRPIEVWNRAVPHLTSPVRAQHVAPRDAFPEAFLAGETALSRQSNLAPPKMTTIAVSGTVWAEFTARHAPASSYDVDEPGVAMVEVWRYPPESLSDGPTVDPLSLFLSLAGGDPRVEEAKATLTEVLE